MCKDSQKQTPNERLCGGAKILANQLARANTHLRFFRGLLSCYGELAHAKDFWDYTLTAHSGMAIRDVSVVYDSHKGGINLINLLRFIDNQSLDAANRQELQGFIAVARTSSADPNVRVLRQWRNKIVAHYNNEIAWTDREDFSKQYPLDEIKLQLLIDKGFEIVEWCTQIASRPAAFPRFAPGKEGHKIVLAMLRARPRS
jgi:hypothetical protein